MDSTPAVARVWAWWASQHGFDPDETVRVAHGRPSIATIRELLPNADHDAENLEVERREIEDVEGVVALPGALELLQALPLDRWAIVTSDDITRGKPDPEPYLKGPRALSFAPSDCIVVEDAPAGIRAGKAAGSRVVALQTTERDELLLEAGASYILRDCSAMLLETSAGRLSFELRNAQAAFR